ncbi:MAG: M48 family metallopeptidase [Bacteroidales bacterium]
MRKVLIELLILIGIGGALWAVFALLIKLPEHPTLISIEDEQSIGERYTKSILSLNDFKEKNDLYIDSVLMGLADTLKHAQKESQYSYKLMLIDSEMVNAFALPGGYVIITTGLIKFCETPEELIAVICHEIGHIEKRHIVSRLIKDVGINLLTSNDPYVSGEIARELLSQGYNREQEEEADLFACELLLKCTLEPRTLASFFRRLKEKNENGLYDSFEILSSHPNMNKRIKTVLSFKVSEDFTPVRSRIDLAEIKRRVE